MLNEPRSSPPPPSLGQLAARRSDHSRKKVLDCLHRIYALRDVRHVASEMMAVVEELVPCVNISFDSVNLATGEVTNVFDRPIPLSHADFMARWEVFCHQHPGIAYLAAGGKAPIIAISDFLSDRQFRETGFFREFFHPIAGTTHQLGIILPVPGYVVGVALNRDRNFTRRERELLEELQPHFTQAFQNAQLLSSIQAAPEAEFSSWRRKGLTHRECEVLTWLAEGKRNAEIAIILHMQPRTVGKHLENIFAKLGVETRAAAAAEARRLARFTGPVFPR